ncbi:MAG: hypothetical protein Q4A42_01540 [Tissierellia bacterium]|nr:hypothetical protein [Tissierellia bacterium]
MKKRIILIFLLTALLASACGKNNETNKDKDKNIVHEKEKNKMEKEKNDHQDEKSKQEGNVNEKDDDDLFPDIDEIKDVDFKKLTTSSEIKDVINGIYGKAKLDKSFLDGLKSTHMLTDLTKADKDLLISYLGKEYKVKEGYVSESGISSKAYLTIVLRGQNSEDAEKLATDLKGSFNKERWVCVTPESVKISSKGDLVILSAGEKKVADEIVKAFEMLK